MTEREKEILNLIKKNPRISHEEISERLHISKSTVAVHISNLSAQGFLLGKAYVVKDTPYVVGIGAANVDIYGKSLIPIRTHYDHPSKIYTSVGGVARNILDNLARLEVRSVLLTAVGEDIYGDLILQESQKVGIDVSNVLRDKAYSSGIFMQVLTEDNEMYIAQCDMSIIEKITPTYLEDKKQILTGAEMIVIDPSLPIESIEYLLQTYPDKKFILDPVSDIYAKKIKPYIHAFYALKPNRTELSVLANMKIKDKDDIKKACQKLLNKGVQKIYVTLAKDGCLYMDQDQCIERENIPAKDIINTSGAGDSFLAGVIYGELHQLEIQEILDYGLAAGSLAIQSKEAIAQDLSIERLNKLIREVKQ